MCLTYWILLVLYFLSMVKKQTKKTILLLFLSRYSRIYIILCYNIGKCSIFEQNDLSCIQICIICCQIWQLKRWQNIYLTISHVYNISFYYFLLSGFVSHQAIARTAGNVLIRLADSLVLPLNCSDYAESLEDYLKTAVQLYQDKLQTQKISMGKWGTVVILLMQGNTAVHNTH